MGNKEFETVLKDIRKKFKVNELEPIDKVLVNDVILATYRLTASNIFKAQNKLGNDPGNFRKLITGKLKKEDLDLSVKFLGGLDD